MRRDALNHYLKFAVLPCFFFIAVFSVSGGFAAETGKPLTLEAALAAAAGSAHPDILAAQAERDTALADRDIAQSRQDAGINLEGVLRSGRQTIGNHDLAGDNSIRLIARKTLYDSGRTDAAQLAAGSEVDAREAELIDAREQKRLDIMARFFDVLLADMQYTADHEFMTVAYLAFDRGREIFNTGQLSRVDLANLETRYQDFLLKRNASLQRQRISRALLANAMNRSSNLPGDLEDPKLAGNKRALPDFETMIPVMLANNQGLKARQALLLASQKRMESVRAEKGPVLDAELQAADYSRSASTRDSLSAGVVLSWPLYQGTRVDSRIARERAQFHKLQAGVEKLKMELTQTLLENYMEAVRLQSVGRSAAGKQVDFRDLALEQSRGLYELELRAALGASMAETVEANLRSRRNEYQLALALARLEALLGKPLDESKNMNKDTK